jgi:hypothetical protein
VQEQECDHDADVGDVVSFGTPVAAFLGVLLAQWITRKGATELETRSRREELRGT